MPDDSPAAASSGDKPSKLSMARGQEVSLGCGTLVLIALIVSYCGGAGTGNLQREIKVWITKLWPLAHFCHCNDDGAYRRIFRSLS